MDQVKPLCAELQKVAIDELGEVPDRIPEDLNALKTWIKQQPHLNARTDDSFLLQFLRGCKYSLERAKEKIDHFYALRTKYPDILGTADVDSDKFRKAFNLGVITPLPTPLNDCGPRIFVFRFNYSTSNFCIEDIFQVVIALNEVLMTRDPYACIHGVVYVADLANATANHFLQFTPSFGKRVIGFLEKTLPLRIKKVVFFNASGTAEQFFKIVFAACSEKLRQRISTCGKDLADLKKHIPVQYLPTDYGGSNGSLDEIVKDYNNVWDEYRDYFKQNVNYGTDEGLRPGNPIDFESVFGAGGSFRKIAVD